jgi:hypothetical protein
MDRLRQDDRGLSLIETLAALVVFSIVTIGITPLLTSSIRGTALARSQTVGKEVAREAMERIRGLPFYVSYGTQANKVDLLDIYLPCADPAMTLSGCGGGGQRSYDATTGVFRIICEPTTEDPACGVRIPEAYTLEFRARFMNRDGETPAFAPGPPNAYAWDVIATDRPRTDLIHMAVTASWTSGGLPRSVTLDTLVGDRQIGDVKVAGTGRLSYGVQVLSSYKRAADPLTGIPEEISDLSAVIGSSESSIESRLVSKAEQRFRTADMRLVIRPADPTAFGVDLDQRLGAVGAYQAPPAFAATTGLPSTLAQTVMNHPSIVNQEVAFLDATRIDSVEVKADAEVPIANGSFTLPDSNGTLGYVWIQPQKPSGLIDLLSNPLRLDYTRRAFSLARGDSGAEQLSGTTTAETGALDIGQRRVETSAQVSLKEARLFPVEFIGTGASFRRSIVQIQNFTASVNCNATGTSALASAQWSATIRYWRHIDGFTTVNVTGQPGGSDLRTVLGVNPLLYRDSLGVAPDLYLFDEPGKQGYFTAFRFAAPITSTEGGLSASADVNEAINITTVPTNPEFAESGLSMSIGKLSCSALDAR